MLAMPSGNRVLWLAYVLLAHAGPVVAAAPADETKLAAATRLAEPDQFLDQYARTNRFRAGRPVHIRPLADGRTILFLRSGPRDLMQDLWSFDVDTHAERCRLSASELLAGAPQQFTAEERARRERARRSARGFTSFSLSRDESRLLAELSGRLFLWHVGKDRVDELHLAPGAIPIDARLDPTGQRVAYVRQGDLYLFDIASAMETRLTTSNEPTISHGLAEFIAQEEMNRDAGYWWSPDGAALAYQQTDVQPLETRTLADPADPSRSPTTVRYPRAGTANAEVRLAIRRLDADEPVWAAWPADQFPYLARVDWPRHGPLTIYVQNRAQTIGQLRRVDPATGHTALLLEERDACWLNLCDEPPWWLPDGRWLGRDERGGDWQLRRFNSRGQPDEPLTSVSTGWRELVHVDEQGTVARGTAHQGDPTSAQVLAVRLDQPGKVQVLTSVPAERQLFANPGSQLVVEQVASANGSAQWLVRRWTDQGWTDPVAEIASRAEIPTVEPRPEWITLDEPRQLRAVLVRPTSFSPTKRYPVVLHAYGGPHVQMVGAAAERYRLAQWLADHGFVVISLDGRGTPGRGRTWERAIAGDLATVPLEDAVAVLSALGKHYTELDLSRVGVFGWSFGGYFAALAVSRRPDVFHVAVAGAPVCDWRDYDTHYTERYLGDPAVNSANYDRSDLRTYAGQLQRPLLIVHGTADDNVFFSHSLRLSESLFQAGRAHEFLPLVGQTHLVSDPLVVQRMYARIAQFLHQHLVSGVESRP